jgi:hypothetical protein
VRATVLDVFAMMLAAVQLSRAVNDDALADDILETTTARALAMLGAAG